MGPSRFRTSHIPLILPRTRPSRHPRPLLPHQLLHPLAASWFNYHRSSSFKSHGAVSATAFPPSVDPPPSCFLAPLWPCWVRRGLLLMEQLQPRNHLPKDTTPILIFPSNSAYLATIFPPAIRNGAWMNPCTSTCTWMLQQSGGPGSSRSIGCRFSECRSSLREFRVCASL